MHDKATSALPSTKSVKMPFRSSCAISFQSFGYYKYYGMEPNRFFGISPNAFGTVGAIVNFAVAHIVSRTTAQAPDDIIDLIEYVRVPKGAGVAHEDMQNI